MTVRLYSYWRSSAAYRVRIALNLKGVDYDIIPVDLAPGVDEQKQSDYEAINPQRLVPFFVDNDVALSQSMAILDYLEERYPAPALLPSDAQARGDVRSACLHIACDVHPLNNVAVLVYLKKELGVDDEQFNAWYRHWIYRVFDSLETEIDKHDGPFVFGPHLTLADLLLVPQVYNARRFDVPLDRYPNVLRVTDHCNTLPAFDAALPEKQPDAP